MKLSIQWIRRRSLQCLLVCSGILSSSLNQSYAKGRDAVTEVQQQKQTVSGVVKDQSGETVIGASVREKGTDNGTITDLDGKFTLSVAPDAVLQITYIGYVTQEVKALVGQTLQVTLKEDAKALDEVVVVGYGTMKKSDLTGAVMRADLKTLKRAPNSNVLQSLQGIVPGLNVGQVTSAGASPNISIRGTNTLGGNTDVLIILDGVIYTSSLSSINPDDIESIDVLKDASSTAVYGAQAANGVILITTKKGAEGKPQVNVSSSYTFSNPTHNYRPMNREEYLDHVRDLYYSEAFLAPDYTKPNPDFDLAAKLPDSALRDENGNVSPYDYDWWEEGTQSGYLFENRISISGGSKSVNYMLSYANTAQEGFIINDRFKRNSVRLNVNAELASWWKVGVQTFGAFVNQDGAEPDLGTLIHQSPLIEPYDAEGNLKPYPFNTLDTNPFMGSDIDDHERHNYFFANISSEIKLPLKGLVYRVNFGNNYRIDNHFRSNKYGYSLQGEAYKNHQEYYDYTIDNILAYNNTFGVHNVDVTLLYGASERKQNSTDAKGQGFSRLTLGYNSLEQATKQYISSGAWHEALCYQMARVGYRLMNRYLLTATVRRDGFSGFAKDNKYATFPSVALGWILSEEPFFKVPWVNYLKLRGGYGISGNLTSRYKSLSNVKSEIRYIFGDGGVPVIGQEVSSLGNNGLKWEKTYGVNFGLDFSLFGQRLTGSLEYYSTTTKDLLFNVVLPQITGFSDMASNVGKIRNKGFELSLTSRNIDTRNFKWSTTFNFSTNSNKILTLTGQDADGDGREDDNIASNLFIGQPISAVYGYRVDGIYQLGDDIPEGFHPGNYHIVDTDEDGDITPDDRVILGRKDPAFRFGIMNTLEYRNFTLSFFINSVQGGKNGYLGENSSSMVRDDNNLRWNHLSAYDYWSPRNPDGIYARSMSSPTITPTVFEKRNFVRLQDISLSYSFPDEWVKKVGLSNANLYFSGKNLLTFTKWHGWDPEPEKTTGDGKYWGSTYWGRPVMRSFSFGISLTY